MVEGMFTMRSGSSAFRAVALISACVLMFGTMPVMAQQDGAPPDAADPPARVGRIARLSGTVSFHGAGQTEWEPAGLNLPVTSGAGLWTEPGGSADIDIGNGKLVLDSATQLEIVTLDDHSMVANENQGSVSLRVRALEAGETFTLNTPRGTVTIAQPGSYVVSSGDTDTPTRVTTIAGAAQVAAPGVSELVGPHQTLSITGTDTFAGQLGPEQLPAFAAAPQRPAPVPTGPSAPPPAVMQMTGGDELMDTGSWGQNPEYGSVWYPPVERDWVPYRHGHWAFVAPWGWTWVDDASWGFAPFHYGRWVEIGPRWGWIPVLPGYSAYSRPVYAPALVAFVGLGVGVGLALSNPVSWIPLGPREVYRPPYHVSNNYIRNVNVTNVTNVTNITNVSNAAAANSFVNHRAATAVPASAMTGSQSVARAGRAVPVNALASAQTLGAAPVAPTRATAGVTPRTAQQLNLPPAAGPARPTAPGPAVRPIAQGVTPPLPQAGAVRPGFGAGQPPRPGQAAAPAAGLPAQQPAGQPNGRPQIAQPGVIPAPGAAVTPGAVPGAARPAPQAGQQPGLPPLRPATPAGQAPVRPPVQQPGAQGNNFQRPANPAQPAAPGAIAQPQARPVVPQAPGAQGGGIQRPAIPAQPAPGAAAQPQARPAVPQPPGAQGGGIQRPAAPVQPAPGAVAPPPVRPVAPAPVQPRPQPQAQPQVAAPQRPAYQPPPQQPRPAPQIQAPQVQHQAPPPVQHFNPPPVQHSAPPAPPPQQQHKSCPDNHPNC